MKHFLGLPSELTAKEDKRVQLPWPKVFIIEDGSDGIFLLRFTKDGIYAGDTWHKSIDDAKHQAEYEYGIKINEWIVVPPNEKNLLPFALNMLQD